jgi:hypothetical protein
MAMPAPKGHPNWGTRKGVPNKATVERAIVAERVLNETRMTDKKLAKERIEEFIASSGFPTRSSPGRCRIELLPLELSTSTLRKRAPS